MGMDNTGSFVKAAHKLCSKVRWRLIYRGGVQLLFVDQRCMVMYFLKR